MKKIFILFLVVPMLCFSQDQLFEGIDDDDLNIGGDIFNDFNEDLESKQMMEDERFFRYGRFFSFQIGIGLTSFTGNRGAAYSNDPPGYQVQVAYFLDFQTSFTLGVELSKHSMFFENQTQGTIGEVDTNNQAVGYGLIDVSILRVHWGYRYYIDTADLGTAITYSNPYVSIRMEYWYLTNKFRDQSGLADDTGGGFGFGLGGGLEFPVKLKESYVNVELLYHRVGFHDKNTQNYKAVDNGVGYDDLTGDAITTTMAYVWSW